MSSEAKILALLIEGPKTSRNLALNSGLSQKSVTTIVKKLRDAAPQQAYIAGWAFTSPSWVPVYAAGDEPDVILDPYSESNMAHETSIRTQVLKALADKPMTTAEIADVIGCSAKTVGTYIKLLRGNTPAKIRIVRYAPPVSAGRWVPVYGRIVNGATKDAAEPTKAQARAYWQSLGTVPVEPTPVRVFAQQSWFSALEAA